MLKRFSALGFKHRPFSAAEVDSLWTVNDRPHTRRWGAESLEQNAIYFKFLTRLRSLIYRRAALQRINCSWAGESLTHWDDKLTFSWAGISEEVESLRLPLNHFRRTCYDRKITRKNTVCVCGFGPAASPVWINGLSARCGVNRGGTFAVLMKRLQSARL